MFNSSKITRKLLNKISIFSKCILKLFLSGFIIILPCFLLSEVPPPYCEDPTPIIEIDLTDSPDAEFHTDEITPNEPCCDAAPNINCIELIIELHPDASYISILWTTAQGSLGYYINCENYVSELPDTINYCFDDPGPHSIVFCRNGHAPYEFSIYSYEFPLEVTLDPFDPLCEDDEGFELTGGWPEGGTYYINSVENDFFDPAEHGPGLHEIEYIYYDEITGCSGSATQTIEVVELPEIILDDQEFCNYGGLKPLEEGIPEGGYFTGEYVVDDYFFDLDAAPPGDHKVYYHYEDICSGIDSAYVTVYEIPEATATADPNTIAEGQTTDLEGSASGGSGNYSYHWEPEGLVQDPYELNTETEPLFNTTIFTLTVTDIETGCIATAETEVVVTGEALSIIDITANPDTICFGETSQLWVQATGGSGTYYYEWSADNAGIDFQPNNQVRDPVVDNLPEETTEFTVVVEDSDGLIADSTVVVFVQELPNVELNLPEEAVCANTPNYALTGGTPEGGTYYMLDQNGNILYLPNIDFSDFLPHDIGEGSYQVLYEYTDPLTGCTDSDIQDFEILPYVKANFHTHKNLCQSNEITINNLSIGENLSYDWDFGDGGDGELIGDPGDDTFIYIYDQHGGFFSEDYTITLIASTEGDQCDHEINKTVTVYPKVEFDVSAVEPEGCSPHTVDFENHTTGPISHYIWEFGDGTSSISSNPTKTYHNYGDNDTTYVFELTAVSYYYNCAYTYTDSVVVYPKVEAGFALNPVEACAPYDAEIMNNAKNAEYYEWDFGDGSETKDSGGEIINHTFENPGPYPDTLTITQTVWIERNDEPACTDIFEKEIVIFPEVTAKIPEIDTVGCAPFTVEFGNESSNATNFHWDFDDGGTSSEKYPSHTFNNTTDETKTFNVEMIAWSKHSCYDTTNIIIEVHPQVTAGFDFSPAYACNPHEVIFTNTSSSASTMEYEWNFGDGSPPDYSKSPTHEYDHDEPDPQKYEIELIVTTDEGCEAIATDSITVYPKVLADFSPEPEIGCSKLEVYFNNNSMGAENYKWYFGDGSASSTDFEPTHVYKNPGYYEIETFAVEMVAESQYLCYDTIVHEVHVEPTPKASFTVEEASGCSPFALNVNNNSEGVSNYTWSLEGEVISTEEIPDYSYSNTSNEVDTLLLHLLVENEYGCASEDSTEIIVYPEFTAQFEEVEDGCHPHEVSFVNTTGNGINYNISYQWDFGDGITSTQENPEHTYLNFSHTEHEQFTTTLFAESEYGCTDIYEQEEITVYPKPLASFWVENPVGCSPHEVIIHNASEGATEFILDLGDGESIAGDDFENVFPYHYEYYIDPESTTEVFDIELEVFNDDGCNDIFTQTVTIYPDIVAEFEVSEDTGCHPLTVNFTNHSQGASGEIEYQWDFGDGNTSTEENPQHTFNNFSHKDDTSYTVTLTAFYEDACYDVYQEDITVQATPLSNFSVLNSPGCAPHEIEVVNESIGATNFEWDFGDGSDPDNSENPEPHEYTQPPGENPGIFTITLDVWHENGCSNQYQQDVTIYPEIEAFFEMNEKGCHPLTVQFENQTAGGENYLWDFGDGNQSQEKNPEHTFYNYSNKEAKTFTITLYAESEYDCQDEYIDTVTIYPLPKAKFTLSETSGCSPFSPTITNKSAGNDLSYLWDFGNGQSEEGASSFTHTWENTTDDPVNYQILLTAVNEFGCSDSTSESINVFPEVTADFTTSNEMFEGCSPFSVKFVNESHLGKYYKWDFDDGSTSTSAEPLHVFINDSANIKEFDVSLEATSVYGCKDTVNKVIKSYLSPEADFIALPEKQPYPQTIVEITNLTNQGEWLFEWDFDDGNSHTTGDFDPFEHDYKDDWGNGDYSTKTYNITLIASNPLCYDTSQQEVTITSPVPEADFHSSTQGCVPFEVQFKNNSKYGNEFRWYFGDGSVSNEENPTHTFVDAGKYDVKLIAIGDGGRDTTYREIVVFEKPIADFELVSNHINIPHEPLKVINKSEMADFYYWEFGDGNTSTEFEPVYYYEEPGLYDVSLSVYTNTDPQCTDTKILEASLRVDESCQVLLPNAFKPCDSGPSGGVCDPNNPTNEVFCPVYEGIDSYVLEIYNRWGELIFRSTDPSKGWDGYFRGKLAKMDVYVWKVTGQCTNGKTINKSGDVTLIR